ncbi:MAG: hypothetical protein IKX60_05070 [Bacteroidales bacterium]|nr:hypothetical protein [Bacteroidales bacterium]
MKKVLYIIICVFIALFIVLIQINKQSANSSYLCNLKSNTRDVYIYIPDTVNMINAKLGYYLNSFNDIDYLYPIQINRINEHLVLVDSCFQDGRLFLLDMPVKGFRCYSVPNDNLISKYASVSDYIYTPNEIVSVYLVPVLEKENLLQTGNVTSISKYLLGQNVIDYYNGHFHRFKSFTDNIVGEYPYPKIASTLILYHNKDNPSISLIYYLDGFLFENNQIMQYPIVTSSNRRISGDTLYAKDGISVIQVNPPYKLKSKKGLIRINNEFYKSSDEIYSISNISKSKLIEENEKANKIIRHILINDYSEGK